MNNRQWMMWKLIDMSDEDFLKWVNCDCVYYKDKEHCTDGCQQNCAEGQLKWLRQEHEVGDSQ